MIVCDTVHYHDCMKFESCRGTYDVRTIVQIMCTLCVSHVLRYDKIILQYIFEAWQILFIGLGSREVASTLLRLIRTGKWQTCSMNFATYSQKVFHCGISTAFWTCEL